MQPHASQTRVFPLVRKQLRGPGGAGYIFRFGVITPDSLAKRRLGTSICIAIAYIRVSERPQSQHPPSQ